jgi:anti-sigma B factor antagonist
LASAASGSGPADVPLREILRPAGPARFELTIEQRADAVVVRVEGELDVLTGPKLTARLNALLRQRATDVVLDLRGVRFMDSAGLQILLLTRRRLLRQSRALSVICADGPVRRLIELARLNETLRVTSS